MAKVLIIFGTKYGQTEKIAKTIAGQLTEGGHSLSVFDARKTPAFAKAEDFDAVIIGGAVYGGKYPKRLLKWVTQNAHALNQMPCAFYSVCLGILEKENEKTQFEIRKIANQFFNESHWHPKMWTIFAGSLPYTKYGWLLRHMMKRIAGKAGGETDTTKDFEYTDWADVRLFCDHISARLLKTPKKRAEDGYEQRVTG